MGRDGELYVSLPSVAPTSSSSEAAAKRGSRSQFTVASVLSAHWKRASASRSTFSIRDEAAYKESISFFYQHIEKRRADSRSKCASVLSFKIQQENFSLIKLHRSIAAT